MKVEKDLWKILRVASLCRLYKDYNRLEKQHQKKDSNKLEIATYRNIARSIKSQQR